MDLAHAQSLWQPEPGWLNTASYGLPPTPAWEAMQTALDAWRHGRHGWEVWGESSERARASFARLVNASVADVSIGAAASQLLGPIAASLPSGSRVVVPDIEFTSLVFPWQVQADRGVQVVTATVNGLIDAIDERTDVVAVSVVQSATGQVVDIDAVIDAARAVGALVVVDGSQAVGWHPVDASRVDAFVCAAYKWLMSPRGTAFLVTSPELRERVRPMSAGWYAGDDVHASYYGLPMELATNGRRFDISPAWFSWVGCAPALELLEEIGIEPIREHDVALANRFRDGLGMPPGDSAIVSVSVPEAAERLERKGIRAAARAGNLRASFHLYSSENDVDLALDALAG